MIEGVPAYHLRLQALRDPGRYRLQELWVDTHTLAPIELIERINFVDGPGTSVPWRVRFTLVAGALYIYDERALLPMRYGGHPPRDSVDYFWSIGWVIRADYPLGTLRYKIAATDLAGRVQTWESFGDPRSQIVIMPGDVEYSGTPQAPR